MIDRTHAHGDPRLAELVRRLVDAVQPTKIYLFGSRARGDATSESDYDVLLLVNGRTESPYELEARAYLALAGFGRAVDAIVMDEQFFERRCQALTSLPATVSREGALLYAA
jgi:predicted nucleotidyltransferase